MFLINNYLSEIYSILEYERKWNLTEEWCETIDIISLGSICSKRCITLGDVCIALLHHDMSDDVSFIRSVSHVVCATVVKRVTSYSNTTAVGPIIPA